MVDLNGILDYGTPRPSLLTRLDRALRRFGGHRGREFAKVVILVLIISAASGLIQFRRCPHATYLQVGGVSIAIVGERCGNVQPGTPWWARQ